MDVDVLLDRVRAVLLSSPPCGVPDVDALVRDALRPGKLLRPDLVIRCARAASAGRAVAPAVAQRVVDGAVAVELLHVATLVHDDIIDAAPLRRGRPSVVAAGGTATAIVVGDLLLARGAAAAARSAGAAATAWARALEAMAVGQLREAVLADTPSVEAHAEYAALKTAELFRTSAEIGALVVDAGADEVAAYGWFGRHFGQAFQHVDDLLDTVGDPVRMGKPVGADVANGVPTAVALLDHPGTAGDVADLVAVELGAARAVLSDVPGGPDLARWAVTSLRRALDASLDDDGRRRAHDVLSVLGAAV